MKMRKRRCYSVGNGLDENGNCSTTLLCFSPAKKLRRATSSASMQPNKYRSNSPAGGGNSTTSKTRKTSLTARLANFTLNSSNSSGGDKTAESKKSKARRFSTPAKPPRPPNSNQVLIRQIISVCFYLCTYLLQVFSYTLDQT